MNIDYGYLAGYIGILFGLLVAPFQLLKLLKTKSSKDISIGTYICLDTAVFLYTLHAISIHSIVFIISNSLSFLINSFILFLLFKFK